VRWKATNEPVPVRLDRDLVQPPDERGGRRYRQMDGLCGTGAILHTRPADGRPRRNAAAQPDQESKPVAFFRVRRRSSMTSGVVIDEGKDDE